jgi:hypothetical protein
VGLQTDRKISRTVEVRRVTPNLILKSAAVLHSSLEASVMSVLLNLVLPCPSENGNAMQKDALADLSMGACGSLDTTVIGPTYPYFGDVSN